ncbi:hypothetical protein G6021_00245 [Dietzia sp. CW19]|uniref:hypothetical protein n=1 Tax=Dietzia sp. CW19 TaxID=1630634 RepID=UPI0015F888B9|nr:hypothetical protein [Dietzia sp. CW19]MBB1049578.1 hypothetical protein [Dietzia sp. CW19]
MSSTSVRTYSAAAVAAALLGAGSFIAPAIAQAQAFNPIDPTDILKIDSPELTVNVSGDTAHFTVVAPENMACVGPLVVEGSISQEDIDPETWDDSFAEDLFSNPVWPTDQSDLRVVVNDSSDLLDQEGAFASPHKVSVPNLNDGDYVATTICVTEDSIEPLNGPSEISTLQDAQFPVAMHFRNFSVTTTGSVNLGSVDVFGSLGSAGS